MAHSWSTVTNVIGKRYHGAVWTNWYRKNTYRAILSLAYMREQLMEHNLKSTYPRGAKIGFLPDGSSHCLGAGYHYRTADGSGNNFDDPKEGAAGTRFPRNVDNSSIRAVNDEELMSPNPRTVSRKLLTLNMETSRRCRS